MTIIWDGSLDAKPLGANGRAAAVPPWSGVQDYNTMVTHHTPDDRVVIVGCPITPDDGHKWVQITVKPGDQLAPPPPYKERANFHAAQVAAAKIKNGDHRFIAWRIFFEQYAPPTSDPQPAFNIPIQWVSSAKGQSPLNFMYDASLRELLLQTAGGNLNNPTYKKLPILNGFLPTGHTVDFVLEVRCGVTSASGFVHLAIAVDGGTPRLAIPTTPCPTIYNDLIALWPAQCIYRHAHPETDIVVERPILMADSYTDIVAHYFPTWPKTMP